MAKNREFVSAFGTANDLVQKIAQAVYARGGNDDDIRRVSSDAALCGRLADQIMGVGAAVTSLVTVDTKLGLKGLLTACELDWSFEGILDPKWNPPPVLNRGRYEVEVEYVALGRDMTTAEMESMLDAKGYRPALPEEALAGCVKDKDRQRKNPIVCIGAFWVSPDGDRHALVLSEYDGERGANLNWDGPGHRWGSSCLVAAVRE